MSYLAINGGEPVLKKDEMMSHYIVYELIEED